mgnify:CR=1 FL=1
MANTATAVRELSQDVATHARDRLTGSTLEPPEELDGQAAEDWQRLASPSSD